MRVFFDNCTAPALAETLNGFLLHRGHSAIHVRSLPCGPHATDLEWIEYLAATGDDWLVVTGDMRIHRNRAERAAFRQNGLKGVVLARAYQKTPLHQLAAVLIWRWPELEDLSLRLGAPFLLELPVSRSARIRVLPV